MPPHDASHQARRAGLSPACSHQGSHRCCDHGRTELAIYGAERRCGEGGAVYRRSLRRLTYSTMRSASKQPRIATRCRDRARARVGRGATSPRVRHARDDVSDTASTCWPTRGRTASDGAGRGWV